MIYLIYMLLYSDQDSQGHLSLQLWRILCCWDGASAETMSANIESALLISVSAASLTNKLRGWSNWAREPWSKTRTWSQKVTAVSSRWATIRTVWLRSEATLKRFSSTVCCDLPSRWDVGSSRRRVLASFWLSMAWAMASSWTWPPESLEALSSRLTSSRLDIFSTSCNFASLIWISWPCFPCFSTSASSPNRLSLMVASELI